MAELTLWKRSAENSSKPNSPELGMDVKTTCSASQLNPSLYGPPLMQACQDYLNAYQQGASLYNITWNRRSNLIIYNTETETQEVKILETLQPLSLSTCIAQLPNGKLFCFGNYELSGITVLIDTNGGVEVLPSGTPCRYSSCIYFNNSIYCFGGENKGYLTLSSRFDLDQNRWIQLTPMPQADGMCNSIMFNGNILISGYENRNLLLYSIDNDSFSTIPYEFATWKRKILINAERLYLIECNFRGGGDIYESEIGIYTNWRQIRKTAINRDSYQVYCSYNKGFIYIGIERSYYFKFDLIEKRLIELNKS